MSKKLFSELKRRKIEFKPDVELGSMTSFKAGGRAACLVEASTIAEAASAVRAFHETGARFMTIGALTNVVAPDKKTGLALLRLTGELASAKKTGRVSVRAGAGMKLGALLSLLAKEGLSGMEFAAGIPGSVGGAVYMNAGAYGESVCSFVTRVYILDKKGGYREAENRECGFGYRTSLFKENGEIVLGADFELKKGSREKIMERMREIIKIRHSKHPWREPSAGSFFKNPGKTPAGALIESAGLKGLRVGGAQVSRKHANFIVNTGGATASDIRRLASKVKAAVRKKHKIELEQEVIFIK